MDPERTTLYLRGIPRRIVREAKAEAARQGSTLAALVSEALDQRLHGARAGEATSGDLEQEMTWYRTHRARLLRQYEGEFVAIADARVVDHDSDFEALARRVFARISDRPVFMPRVEAEDRVARMRSPRRAR
jgi:hypothetical protein